MSKPQFTAALTAHINGDTIITVDKKGEPTQITLTQRILDVESFAAVIEKAKKAGVTPTEYATCVVACEYVSTYLRPAGQRLPIPEYVFTLGKKIDERPNFFDDVIIDKSGKCPSGLHRLAYSLYKSLMGSPMIESWPVVYRDDVHAEDAQGRGTDALSVMPIIEEKVAAGGNATDIIKSMVIKYDSFPGMGERTLWEKWARWVGMSKEERAKALSGFKKPRAEAVVRELPAEIVTAFASLPPAKVFPETFINACYKVLNLTKPVEGVTAEEAAQIKAAEELLKKYKVKK